MAENGYTHRVAISNRRLVEMREGRVCFRWKDYARGNVQKTMSLAAPEFIRRFLLHVLPRGFVRIRHYGFLANRCRQDKLQLCRQLLGASSPPQTDDASTIEAACADEKQPACPRCKEGRLVIVDRFDPSQSIEHQLADRPLVHSTPEGATAWDTS